MSKEAIVLFAHGARDPEWAKPARRVTEELARLCPEAWVTLAFLEFMSPSLEEAVDAAAASGVESLRVVPLFLAQGGHLKRDLPVLLEAARSRHPACRIELVTAVGEDEGVVRAMARCAAGL
ncbi:CbiX/SirB N-terminal domain-containing protein [Zoogloea sp.]|uniref:sirohydrochlorin chelatase n=1 Tax=Zoogloea sp. TaxID=49181 RepID=UPI0026364C90|nr:CbiX/SirB N-terminal domain-containing protein [Zoogloea sp.]MDD3352503.1 CbiX/SirB N-terminal domain-containing protein [Zoogloea sp.]